MTLKPKQARAISALLTSKTFEEAARLTDVTTRTLREWMKIPEFSIELQRQEDELTDEIRRRLASGTSKALQALEGVITEGNDANKRQAAAAWIDFNLKYSDRNIEARLTALEQVIYGNK